MSERAQALEAALRECFETIAGWRIATMGAHQAHVGQFGTDHLARIAAVLAAVAPPVGVSPQPDQQRRGNYYGQPLSVSVQDGRLVVAIGVQTIAHATAFADWANPFDEAADDYIRTFAIEDAPQFAKDVVSAMLSESEDGSTPLSDFLDNMAQAAIDDGSLGIHEDEQQIKHGTFAPCETWAVQSPASLSPVESTPSREPLTGAELLDRFRPVEPTPEPPTNPPCRTCGHPLSAHRPEFGLCDGAERPCACPEFAPSVSVEPAPPTPAPCVWRDITKERPPHGVNVDVWARGRRIADAYYVVNEGEEPFWCDDEGYNVRDVTHWMPLPAPPQITR